MLEFAACFVQAAFSQIPEQDANEMAYQGLASWLSARGRNPTNKTVRSAGHDQGQDADDDVSDIAGPSDKGATGKSNTNGLSSKQRTSTPARKRPNDDGAGPSGMNTRAGKKDTPRCAPKAVKQNLRGVTTGVDPGTTKFVAVSIDASAVCFAARVAFVAKLWECVAPAESTWPLVQMSTSQSLLSSSWVHDMLIPTPVCVADLHKD